MHSSWSWWPHSSCFTFVSITDILAHIPIYCPFGPFFNDMPIVHKHHLATNTSRSSQGNVEASFRVARTLSIFSPHYGQYAETGVSYDSSKV